MVPSDYATMAQGDGTPTPNPVTFDDLRRKLGGIAKQKVHGYSGNGPDLHASMPDVWATDVLTLLNIIQHSGVTPHAWHVDLMHYVHKGGVEEQSRKRLTGYSRSPRSLVYSLVLRALKVHTVGPGGGSEWAAGPRGTSVLAGSPWLRAENRTNTGA